VRTRPRAFVKLLAASSTVDHSCHLFSPFVVPTMIIQSV
jgi:hypothetical protein